MDYQQKNNIIQRLIVGYTYCVINGEKYIVKNPHYKLLMQANQLYKEIVQKYRFAGWLADKQCQDILIQMERWYKDGDRRIEKLEERLDKFKIQLYEILVNMKNDNMIRMSISNLKREINDLWDGKNCLNYITTKGYAEIIRMQFLLLNTVYNENDELVDINYDTLNQLKLFLDNQSLKLSEVRELARTEPWNTYWSIKQENVFGCHPVELTDEQRSLISFSRLYSNIYDNAEHPSDSIINDDDALDGWLLLQKQQRDKDRLESQVEKVVGNKHGAAQEVFIPVANVKEAQKLNKLNDPHGRMIKKQRFQTIQQRGVVKEIDLPDKRLEVQMQGNRQFVQTLKGK